MDILYNEVREEIEALHRFISAWFRGEIEQDRKVYDEGFAKRLGEGFENIQPSGQVLTAKALLDPIWAGHGRNPDFKIEIHEPEIRHTLEGGSVILATYLEIQLGAKNTEPSKNARRSTVLFGRDAVSGKLIWLHVHETAVDVAEIGKELV